MTKTEALQQGYESTGRKAYSSMYMQLEDLVKKGKLKQAKELAESFDKSPEYWYQKGGYAVAVQELTP